MRKLFTITTVILALLVFSASAMAQEATVKDVTATVDNVNAAAGVTNNNEINFPDGPQDSTVRNYGTGYRGFPEGAPIPIPGSIGYYGDATPGHQFAPVRMMIFYKDLFNEAEIDNMLNSGKNNGRRKPMVRPFVKPVDEDMMSGWIKVYTRKPEAEKIIPVGLITVKATSKDSLSADVLAECMERARELGANSIHVMAEGAQRELKSFTWGIGISYSQASMANGGKGGSLGGGGTGISGGTAGYHDMPWLQIHALVVVEDEETEEGVK